MTIRPKAVRSLRDARERMRDIAAARHAAATHAAERSAARVAEETDTLDDFLDEAPTLLEAATSVEDLMRVGDSTGEFELAVLDAEEAHAKQTAATERSACELRERSRQLRSVEKLAERLEHDRVVADNKREQLRSDEMASARRR
jgi:flagellar biosynthesis chaperone FliJ